MAENYNQLAKKPIIKAPIFSDWRVAGFLVTFKPIDIDRHKINNWFNVAAEAVAYSLWIAHLRFALMKNLTFDITVLMVKLHQSASPSKIEAVSIGTDQPAKKLLHPRSI